MTSIPAPELPVSPYATEWTCAAFVLCTREAVGWVNHPILGAYPSCRECASILGATLGELCIDHDEWWACPFDTVAYATPCNGTPSTEGRCPRCLDDHIRQCAACQAEIGRTEDRD